MRTRAFPRDWACLPALSPAHLCAPEFHHITMVVHMYTQASFLVSWWWLFSDKYICKMFGSYFNNHRWLTDFWWNRILSQKFVMMIKMLWLWEWYDCCQDDGFIIIPLMNEWRRWFEDDGYDKRIINDLRLTNFVNFRVIDDLLTEPNTEMLSH